MSQPEPKRPFNELEPTGKRPEKGWSTNLFWFLIILITVGAILFSLSSRSREESLSYSEFVKRLEEKTLHGENVFQLRRGLSTMTFQDQPKNVTDAKQAIKHFTVPVGSMSDAEKGRLDEQLRNNKIVDWGYEEPPSPWRDPILLLILFAAGCIGCIWLMLRRMGGPGSAIAFGRSRGKLFAQEDVGISFNDVAGIDEAVEELREIVDFLRNPGRYQALGGRIPRGVLLVGPPGTGKTLLAKAVAGEAGVPFFSLSGSDFIELFVGVGAARVRDMFQQAGEQSPSIIFIDELDAIGKVRSHGSPGGGEERDQTLNALLVEMDGFSSDQSVIVLGATNRPETLDPALMRPGRFDRHVLVDRPDIRGREAILKVHAAKIKMEEGVNLKHLAKLTAGFVGADLANLVNEAALLAARNNKTAVTTQEFDEGFDRVVAGLEKSARVMPEEVRQRVAWHEVGHALVACSLPNVDPVHKISIIPRGLGALGYTLQRPEDDRQLITKTEMQHRICVLMGGIAAEELIYHENSTGASNDLQRATDFARRMITEFGMSEKLGRVHYSESRSNPFLGGNPATVDHSHSESTIREIDLEVRRIIDAAYHTAYELLSTRRDVMEHITRELMEKEVMDSAQLQAILSQYQTGPQLVPATSTDEPVSLPIRVDEVSGLAEGSE